MNPRPFGLEPSTLPLSHCAPCLYSNKFWHTPYAIQQCPHLLICASQIPIENFTSVICITFSMQILNCQSKLSIDTVLNCTVMYLPVYQSLQLIYQHKLMCIKAYQCISPIEMHCCIAIQKGGDKRCVKMIFKQNKMLR